MKITHGSKSTRGLAAILSFWLCLSLVTEAQTKYVHQYSNGRLAPDTSSVKMSPEDQIKVGREAAAEVEKQLPMLPDSSPETQYVQQLGRRLVDAAPGYKWPFEFHVVNQKEINAFALPGGPVFVNLGTLQTVDSEAELAGVMAHEIGHVVMMHSARQAADTRKYQIAGALGSLILGGMFGGTALGALGQLGMQLGANGVIMKYSRTAETEADLMGAQIMYDVGFNPEAMVTFFNRLKQQNGDGAPEFLSDHPDPGNRAETIQQVISKFPKKQYVSDSPRFQQVRAEAQKMHALTAQEIAQRQRNGGMLSEVSASEVMPSGETRQLQLNAFSISYPANWKVMRDPEGKSVVIAPAAGVSQDEIAYGVSIGAAKGNGGETFDEISQEILKELRRNNPDIKAVGSLRQIRVNGVSGRSVELKGLSPVESPSGTPLEEHNWLVSLPRQDGSVLFVICTAPAQNFPKLRPTFEAMLRSLQLH